MDNLWRGLDKIKSEIENPKVTLEQQANYLNQAMDGIIEAEVEDANITSIERINYKDEGVGTDFVYMLSLKSDYVLDYRYKLLKIVYGIKFFPMCLSANRGILDELVKSSVLDSVIQLDSGEYLIQNVGEFETILSCIFNSNEVMLVLSNLKTLAEGEKGRFRFDF